MNQMSPVAPSRSVYLLSLAIPPLSIVMGIVAMTRNYVIQGLALWALGFLSFWIVWPFVIMVALS